MRPTPLHRRVGTGTGDAELDDVDRIILRLLQEDARMPNVDIGERVNLSRSAVGRRLQTLERQGLIEAYRARVDHVALGLGATGFTVVALKDYAADAEVEEQLCRIPEVLEVHVIAGDGDFLVKLRAESLEALHHLFRERIQAITGVSSLRTLVALHTSKETIVTPAVGAVHRSPDEGHP